MVFRVASSGGSSGLVIGAGATQIAGGTANRVLFESGAPVVISDSANLTFDGTLLTSGTIASSGFLRILAANLVAPASGTSVEIYYANNVVGNAPTGYLVCYDRTGSAYKPMEYDASAHRFQISSNTILLVDSSGIDAVGYKAGGTAGVASFGPAAVTSITVKNGLVVAIS